MSGGTSAPSSEEKSMRNYSTANVTAPQSLGTCPNGQIIPHVLCANRECLKRATMTCSKCHLAKYCCRECQAQHWTAHKKDCKHPYMSPAWQPAWVREERSPAFISKNVNEPEQAVFGAFRHYLWGNVPAINCLQLARNEGQRAASMDLKLCFAASGDLRNLIMTVNDLPDNYAGKCDILCNDLDGVVVNRNLVILFVLLTPGIDAVDAAELAVHLMYSAALTPAMADYCRQCTEAVYSVHGAHSGVWDTRGAGKVRSLQRISDLQPVLQMFRSRYILSTALASMRSVMWNPTRVDYVDRHLSSLEPGHRVSFARFRRTGVLASFTTDVSHFTEPNRLIFSSEGKWLSMDNANPLFGWDLATAFDSGSRHGATRSDSYGCLFFFLKDQFQKFARRAKDFKLDITLSQANAMQLSQQIPAGSVPNIQNARFDRIETSNLADYFGASRVISDWVPTTEQGQSALGAANELHELDVAPAEFPRARRGAQSLREIVCSVGGVSGTTYDQGISPAKASSQGVNSPQLIQSIECAEAFYDNEHPFAEFLKKTGAQQAATSAGGRLRPTHRIHPKRSGLSLDKPTQTVPKLTKTAFHDLFLLGGVNYSDRFVEVEVRA
ncbi:hypothetical protein DFH09DRAFT_1467346 [Mycena vulgaris]|nr:hypothetical protein DFH09DRAFT_1467346 [Mycena vulgaris]